MLACVAGVFVRFRSKKKALVLAAREMKKQEPKNERGGRGSQFFARSLTLVPCSLPLNRTKTLLSTSVHPLFLVVTYRWRYSWLSSHAAHSKCLRRGPIIFPPFLCSMSESVGIHANLVLYGWIFPLSIPAEEIFNVQRGY